jgi:diaminopimelate epimerase
MKLFKMHGAANDFIMFIASNKQQALFTRPLIKKLCQRHSGIGADGVILVLPNRKKGADFRMRIFNADGSEAEMCGNGIRCLGKLVYEQHLTNKKNLIVETLSGNIPLKLLVQGNKVTKVSVTLAAPSLIRPIRRAGVPARKISPYKIKVILGNPHCVVFLDESVSKFPVAKYGPLLERHHLFPQRTNVEFVQVKNRGAIDMRVWERGVGETPACGTGACAAVMAGIATNKLRSTHVKVNLPGGVLEISKLKNGKICLIGPAEMVFEGDVTTN